MNQMLIKDVAISDKKINISYMVSGDWINFFHPEESFYIEYSKSIINTPKSIAVIPFISNILPIAWLFDAVIVVDELDEDFYNSIKDFKQGYINMHPKLKFLGALKVKKIIKNYPPNQDKTATFFSGGVDAFHTLLSHIEEKPILLTIWGADISVYSEKGWQIVENHISNVAKTLDLEYVIIKSSFRNILNEDELNNYTRNYSGDNWWREFQHGIALIGHAAPYSYQCNIKTVYIASSNTIAEKGINTCASDPTIDNYVRFCNCRISHDGYEYNRQEKIKFISKYVEQTGIGIQLRVCWESSGGSNCCHCEKCYRTILGLIAEKKDPYDYGFGYKKTDFKKMMFNMRSKVPIQENSITRNYYKKIQERLRENYSLSEINIHLKWFYRLKIAQNKSNFINRYLRKLRKALGYFKRKVIRKNEYK